MLLSWKFMKAYIRGRFTLLNVIIIYNTILIQEKICRGAPIQHTSHPIFYTFLNLICFKIYFYICKYIYQYVIRCILSVHVTEWSVYNTKLYKIQHNKARILCNNHSFTHSGMNVLETLLKNAIARGALLVKETSVFIQHGWFMITEMSSSITLHTKVY